MIHDTVGGGLVGALIIFGGIYAGIVCGASIALSLLAKNVSKLQGGGDSEAAQEEAAA
ncbi:MAG: hypothetical protein KDH09_01185 [Chrysiogenetes bacterium]|nr:hypothetical protein [Chrysiogenetes bacterium]